MTKAVTQLKLGKYIYIHTYTFRVKRNWYKRLCIQMPFANGRLTIPYGSLGYFSSHAWNIIKMNIIHISSISYSYCLPHWLMYDGIWWNNSSSSVSNWTVSSAHSVFVFCERIIQFTNHTYRGNFFFYLFFFKLRFGFKKNLHLFIGKYLKCELSPNNNPFMWIESHATYTICQWIYE